MKSFFRKHKIFMIALCGVLCIGIFSGLLLTGVINLSKSASSFKTVAEAKEETNAPKADLFRISHSPCRRPRPRRRSSFPRMK